MLKRILSVICILSLALSLVPAAFAAPITEYALENKLQKQLVSSGLNGTVTLSASGEQFENLGLLRWTLVRNFLSGMTVSVSSSVLHSSREDRETVLKFLYNGQESGTADILNNGEKFAVSSTLLSPSAIWYTFPAEMNLISNGSASSWPDVWRMLFRFVNASEDWQKRANAAAAPYYARMGAWLQKYMEITTEADETGSNLKMHCQIPGSAVIEEMKDLISALHADEQCMSILSEVLSTDESAAYLAPALDETLRFILDNVQLNGNVVIDRIYDVAGNIKTDRISLPFTDNSLLSHLTYSETLTEGEKEYSFSGAYRTNTEEPSEDDLYSFLISMVPAGEEGLWNGSIYVAYPLANAGSFEVADEAAETFGHFEATFALGIDAGEENYDAKQDLSSKESSLTLTVRPIHGDTTGLHATSIVASLGLSSKSKATAPTSLNAAVTVTDQETGANVGLEMNFRTAVRWEPALIENLPASALRLEAMTPSQLYTIKELWLKQLTAWFTGLTSQTAKPQ